MTQNRYRTFAEDGSTTVTMATGQVAHRDIVAHNEVIAERFYTVRPGVWCLVGNGLSNQTFIEGPDGIIAIDTGESIEEMAIALKHLRTVTDRPIVAVLYTHFHYVAGTKAILAEAGATGAAGTTASMPIWGHERIVGNRSRTGGEIAPAYGRGLVHQFGIMLPTDGPDGVVNVGLGPWYRNPAHAPFTGGFVPPTDTFGDAVTIHVAGLQIDVSPAPSDADDSVTFWFPSLGVCINNLVWPTLFNVFAIRGEEYRDPRILLTGLDHLLGLSPEYLVGAHGPPITGASEIAERVTRYRDSIQFLWDQTVRGMNKGWTLGEIADRVRMPAVYGNDYLTQEHYGVAEHHVRQIHAGVRGFYDGDESVLFPVEPKERFDRLIAGFGGRENVRAQATAAYESNDLRWALELGTWLSRSSDAEPADHQLLAGVLRTTAQRTSAANIRNWCLTRARDLEGTTDLARFRTHRFRGADVIADPINAIRSMRVVLDPDQAVGVDVHLGWQFTNAPEANVGLHVRNGIAVPTDGTAAGAAAGAVITTTTQVWAGIMSGSATLSGALGDGSLTISGPDAAKAAGALAAFEIGGLRK